MNLFGQPPEKIKEKLIYEEKYKKRGAVIRKELLPKSLPFLNDVKILRIEILSAGVCEFNGEEQEFQTLKIYVERPPKAKR